MTTLLYKRYLVFKKVSTMVEGDQRSPKSIHVIYGCPLDEAHIIYKKIARWNGKNIETNKFTVM